MSARDHAKPVSEDSDAGFAGLPIIKPKPGRCCLRGSTYAPRDRAEATHVVPMVVTL